MADPLILVADDEPTGTPTRVPPEPPLADEAVLLRLPRTEDAAAIAAACADPEIARWVPIPVPYTLTDAQEFLAIVEAGWADGAHATFAIEDRAANALAGMIGLDREATPGRASVGYWLAPAARGRGFATRAVRLVAAWAFEDPRLERLELMTLVGNAASGRVALRAGFRREGILRRYLPFRSGVVDAVMYARVRDGTAATAGDGATGDGGADRGGGADRVSGDRLGAALDAWDRATVALGALTGTGGPAASPLAGELLDTLREEISRRAQNPPSTDAPDAGDRRDAVATLLGALGIPEPLEPAASLVALGWDGNELDDLLEPFGTDEARLVVATWIAANALVRLLLAEGTGIPGQVGEPAAGPVEDVRGEGGSPGPG